MKDIRSNNIAPVNSATGVEAQNAEAFELAEFFPYLARIYYRAISEAISGAYTERYGLSVSEWRTMAALGPYKALSASDIVSLSSMNKVSVSRAIKSLQGQGFLKRDIDGDDKRRAVLRLTQSGRKTFIDLVPLVKQREAECLSGLSAAEQAMLILLMQRVQLNAERMTSSQVANNEEKAAQR